MNIGSIKQNDAGIFVGKIATLAIAMTIALREVHSANPKAPKYEVLALSASRAWVQVGALFELASNSTGEAFLNGKIEDPSLAAPLYVSAFRQEDGSYNVVWSRPTRRRDLASEMAPKADEGLPPLNERQTTLSCASFPPAVQRVAPHLLRASHVKLTAPKP